MRLIKKVSSLVCTNLRLGMLFSESTCRERFLEKVLKDSDEDPKYTGPLKT